MPAIDGWKRIPPIGLLGSCRSLLDVYRAIKDCVCLLAMAVLVEANLKPWRRNQAKAGSEWLISPLKIKFHNRG